LVNFVFVSCLRIRRRLGTGALHYILSVRAALLPAV
jgi:hypothetical protein